MRFCRIAVLYIALIIFCQQTVFADHSRAANIVVEHIDGLRYRLVFYFYRDAGSDASLDFSESQVCIRSINPITQEPSDCNPLIPDIGGAVSNDFIISGNGAQDTQEYIYSVEHTFPSSGRYLVSTNIIYRNRNINNIGSSQNATPPSLQIQTEIEVGGPYEGNNSPTFTIPPIDKANIGQTYIHNPGAYDPDGDSLAYEFVTPSGNNVLGQSYEQFYYRALPDYTELDDPIHGLSTLSINPSSGIITWDAPTIPGEYNIAFIVKEIRDGRIIGRVTRDMQIFVEDYDNIKPEIIPPPDRCASAGDTLIDIIAAYDPDGDALSSGIQNYGLPSERGEYITQQDSITGPDPTPAETVDSIDRFVVWVTGCDDIQAANYISSYRVEDNDPQVPLSDSKTRVVQVNGPAPQNLTAQPQGNTIQLTWDPYICTSNARRILIWRKQCDTTGLIMDSCTAGVPPEWDFNLIAEVDPTTTSYLDNNGVGELSEMVQYYYVISVEFQAPQRGLSYPSNITRAAIEVRAPILYEVSADTSRLDDPVFNISWIPPFELPDPTADIEVSVIRDAYDDNTIVSENEVLATYSGLSALDSTFTDSQINDSLWYQYRITLNENGVEQSSPSSSNIIASSENNQSSILINWDAQTTWTYPDSLYNYIWRISPDSTVTLLDSVPASERSYEDFDVVQGDTNCYFIEMHSVFCHDSTSRELINFSQKTCSVAFDTIPPCPPVAYINRNDCDNFDSTQAVVNTPFWSYPASKNCIDSLASYEIYEVLDTGYALLETLVPTDTFYNHTNIDSYAKCYAVRAVDVFGNISQYSNIVCNDNCEYVLFPNILILGGSPPNNLFNPFPDSRYIDEITFKVYNRWGELVFEQLSNEQIDWDGKNNNGEQLSSGVYFYSADVKFDILNPEENTYVKGWIHLLEQ